MIFLFFIESIVLLDVVISSFPKEVVPLNYKEYRIAADPDSPTFSIKPIERIDQGLHHISFLRNSTLHGYKMFVKNVPVCFSKNGGLEACVGDEDSYTLWKIEDRGKGKSICTQKFVGANIMSTTNFCISVQKNNCYSEMPYLCIDLKITPYNEASRKQLFLIEEISF